MFEAIKRLFGGKGQRSRVDDAQGEGKMVSAFDVVAYILDRKGQMSGKRELHAIPVHRLDKSAQRRLEEIRQADIEQLFTMRIEKKPRIWGIKDRIYFRVLWWDPDHQVYPVNITNN